jgi:voltage-gated potassium channel
MSKSIIRKKIFDLSYVDENTDAELSWFNRVSICFTLFAIVFTVLSTEDGFVDYLGPNLRNTELALGIVFSIEILLRFWSVGENAEFAGFTGRLRYLKRPSTVLDIVATAPLLMTVAMPGSPLLRGARLLRLIRFANLGRFSKTISYFSVALKSHGPELAFTFLIAMAFLIVSATALYLIEGSVQPEAFGSIPRALWWAMATLTTVGYGDVYPITAMGKFVTAIIAFIGVGTVALPAGIFAAAFSEAFILEDEASISSQNIVIDEESGEVTDVAQK